MRLSTRVPSVLTPAALFVALALASVGFARQSTAPGTAGHADGASTSAERPLLYFYSGGLERLLVDERDAGVLRALSMLDERLLELPSELGEPFPEPVLRLLCDVLLSPHDIELHLYPLEERAGAPPVDGQLRVFGNQDKRNAIGRGLETLFAMAGMSSQPVEGQSYQSLPLPVGSLYHGEAQGAGAEAYFVSFGDPRMTPTRLSEHGLPDGVQPALYLSFDATALQPYLSMAVDMAGAQGELLYEFFERFGLLSDTPLAYHVAMGFGADRSHSVVRLENGVEMLDSLGSLVREPLTAAEMRLIPADAVHASMWKSSSAFVPDLLETVGDASGEDILGKIQREIGIDLRSDVFDVLGEVSGFYMADSTGGGGLASTVMFHLLEDGARMEATIQKVARKVDALAATHARGYVAMRSWMHGDQRCTSLQFPGLPIPLELSMAVADDTLWVAATPQALLGALAHAGGSAKGLVDGAHFRSAAHGSLENLSSFSFQDTPRLLREGYGTMSLLMSALANAVRSPRDSSRDPGLVLPSYPELCEGSRPTLLLGRIEGADFVMRGEGDRSMTAGFTAALSNPMMLVACAAVGASVAMPNIVKERQMANERAHLMEPAAPDHDHGHDHPGGHDDH